MALVTGEGDCGSVVGVGDPGSVVGVGDPGSVVGVGDPVPVVGVGDPGSVGEAGGDVAEVKGSTGGPQPTMPNRKARIEEMNTWR